MARILMTVTFVLGAAIPAGAQIPAPALPTIRTGVGQRAVSPTTSPYLNLLRRDGGIGFQYYRRVLPEREFRSAYRRQFQALGNLSRQIEEINRPQSPSLGGGLGRTGHPTVFQSYGGSFGGAVGRSRPPVRR